MVEWFAGRLRELRTEARLSQQELADKAGLKLGAIRDLEQGRNSPKWETVLALAAALGVSCEAFNEEAASMPTPTRGRPRKPNETPANEPKARKEPKARRKPKARKEPKA